MPLPEITKLEAQIYRSGGETFRTSLSPTSLQASKEQDRNEREESRDPTLRLIRENGYLRQELAQNKATIEAMGIFWEKTQGAFLQLREALQELSTRVELAESSLLAEWGIKAHEAEDVTVL